MEKIENSREIWGFEETFGGACGVWRREEPRMTLGFQLGGWVVGRNRPGGEGQGRGARGDLGETLGERGPGSEAGWGVGTDVRTVHTDDKGCGWRRSPGGGVR